jgi:ISXO2-like transposase domain
LRVSIFEGINSIKFNSFFKTDDDCIKYLSEIKCENGYECKKCKSRKFIKGSRPHNRRCLKCKYDESPTAGTMFDKVKFSMLVAFHIVFKVVTKKKGMSTLEVSREFELRQKTCWEFKWKIQQAMESSLNKRLEGIIHVDEFFVGGPEDQKRGRSKGKKKLVAVAIEIISNGVGRAYAEVIEHASSEELGAFLIKYVSLDAKIISDVWAGYTPLKKIFINLEQIPSDNGKNFGDLHLHIMNIKGWIRGIHHHCSKKHIQGYLNEYHYRYNRRAYMGTMFDLLMKRMVNSSPKRIK